LYITEATWSKKGCKLQITTRKITDKDIIEILDSEDELLAEEGDEEEGKEPDTKGEDGKAPDS
jgi:hypothetical protein